MAEETSNTVSATNAPAEVAAPSASDLAGTSATAESTEEVAKADDVSTVDKADVSPLDQDLQTNGAPTPASSKKEKRKSTSNVSDPKNKKLNRKSSVVNLNLNFHPGDLVLAKLKSFPWWPAIVCDQPMLPEDMLSKRPVSGMRPDGSYREDFLEGGKNARDRRYPVMFLHAMDFYWVVNTDIKYLTAEEAQETIDAQANKKSKISKDLQAAYKLAAEGHDFDKHKELLKKQEEDHRQWLEETRRLQEEEEEAAAQQAAEDVEMADAAAEPAVKKTEKKRKAATQDADAEGNPVKTPKKLKIKPPQEKATPIESSATKPKKAKKEKVVEPPKSPVKPVEPVESAEDLHEKMQKTILFLRHKLQKGFLSRDKPPEESEMPTMHGHMNTLENYHDLEGSIIRTTKINKVLKAIMKLATIPREHEFNFKKRSQDILASWSKQLDDPAGTPAAAGANGVDVDEKTPAATNGTNGPTKAEPIAEAAETSTKKEEDATKGGAESKADEPVASVEAVA